jgi:hypothetical protein
MGSELRLSFTRITDWQEEAKRALAIDGHQHFTRRANEDES